jgi:predicted amidohydrolase
MEIKHAISERLMTKHALRMIPFSFAAAAFCLVQANPARGGAGAPGPTGSRKPQVRVCASQPPARLIDWRLKPAEALAEAGKTLVELEKLVRRAGDAGCDVLAFPEDTLGLLHWEMGNPAGMKEVLPAAVPRMLERLGRAAASYGMYLVCSSDTAAKDGSYRNTSFFLGRDGKEIGRYYKVNLPIYESAHKRGEAFPVFETPDLGGVGMLICYDMMMPEAARVLALAGADIVFVPTMGGASYGDGDMDRAAFRTRAADNFVYLVVAKRGGGAMIISPKGKILAEGKEANDIAMADIDPFGGREAGDAVNSQKDMRARLFRERNPAAYGLLTDPRPPVLQKLPETISVDEAVRIGAKTLTVGNERFQEAEALFKAGRTAEARQAFEKLCAEFPHTWVDRSARARLAKMGSGTVQ